MVIAFEVLSKNSKEVLAYGMSCGKGNPCGLDTLWKGSPCGYETLGIAIKIQFMHI